MPPADGTLPYKPPATASQVIGPTQQQYQIQPPAATAPTTPAPAPASPAAPAPTTPTTAPQTAQNAPGQAQTPLSMSPTGSVVDLLNMAGQDSSFAARKQLATQYGIQGYTGTAQQNQDLSKKYLDAYNANKGKTVPDTGAQATAAIDTYFKENTPETQEDPQRAFFDQYMSMNPIVKTMYDSINTMLAAPATTQTFKQEYDSLLQAQGIPGLQTELMNIKNIMDGTEDDLRTEIEKAGGFATESQVAALSAARNKTLLKQANVLQQQLALKEDYVNQIMQFSKLDREQVEKDVDRKLGLTGKLAEIQDKITTAAKDNFQKVVDKVGYQGLADAFAGDTRGMKMAEQALGLPYGALSSRTFLESQKANEKPQIIGSAETGYYTVKDGVATPLKTTGGKTIGGSAGGGASMGTGVSGSISRDANSVMNGVLNLQDISTKDNYRAQVASELNRLSKEALAEGDIYGAMKASAAFDKEAGDTFLQSMEKLVTTLDQIGVLEENIAGTRTGPLAGAFRGANPWDTNAQTIKAQLNAIVPNLARGVYGEVGVLTDNDIKNYAKTLPNLTSTEDIRNAVLYITVDMIRRNAESKIRNQAAGQRDMSGYADVYKGISETADSILSRLPGSAKPGAQKNVAPSTGQTRVYQGATYRFDGSNWVKQK